MKQQKTYTTVIADDEPFICQLVHQLIHWESLPLRFVGTAHSGAALLELIRSAEPDIVITDICMPDMNGIDVIREVREEGRKCRFIIISGYRQFEYAHNALRYNVDSYLLKPVREDELNRSLSEVTSSFVANGSEMHSEAKAVEGNRHRLMLSYIMNNTEHPEYLSSDNLKARFEVCPDSEDYCCCLIKLDMRNTSGDVHLNSLSLTENIAHTFVHHLEHINMSVYYYCNIDSVMLLIGYQGNRYETLIAELNEGYTRSCQLIDLFIDIKMTLGISASFKVLSSYANARLQTMCSLWTRILFPARHVFIFDELGLSDDVFVQYGLREQKNDLMSSVEALDINAFKRTAEELLGSMNDTNHTVRIGIMLNSICRPVAERLAELLQKNNDSSYLYNELLSGLYNSYSTDTLNSGFFTPITTFLEQLCEENNERLKKPIRDAIAFIQANYATPLRLEIVASKVFLSPHYFSSLFLSETGQNFSDFLIDTRIDTAKKLLQSSALSIKEISTEVGYPDARYFSRLFLQRVGIKPKEYRKIYG